MGHPSDQGRDGGDQGGGVGGDSSNIIYRGQPHSGTRDRAQNSCKSIKQLAFQICYDKHKFSVISLW